MSRRTVAERRRYNQMVLEEWEHYEFAGRTKFEPPRVIFPALIADLPVDPWARVGRHLRAVTIRLETGRYLRKVGAR